MSMDRNLERFLERADKGPEPEDPDSEVEGERESRSAVDETLPARDEDEVELQREESPADDPQP